MEMLANKLHMAFLINYGYMGNDVTRICQQSQTGLPDLAKLTSMLTKQTLASMNEKA